MIDSCFRRFHGEVPVAENVLWFTWKRTMVVLKRFSVTDYKADVLLSDLHSAFPQNTVVLWNWGTVWGLPYRPTCVGIALKVAILNLWSMPTVKRHYVQYRRSCYNYVFAYMSLNSARIAYGMYTVPCYRTLSRVQIEYKRTGQGIHRCCETRTPSGQLRMHSLLSAGRATICRMKPNSRWPEFRRLVTDCSPVVHRDVKRVVQIFRATCKRSGRELGNKFAIDDCGFLAYPFYISFFFHVFYRFRAFSFYR